MTLKPVWDALRWRLAYLISRASIGVGSRLPTRLCYALAGPIADLCFVLLRRHRSNLITNLERVVGPAEAEAAARRAFRNFGRYVVDLYQLPSRGSDELHRRIEFSDWQALDGALEDGNGALFVTLHLGQVELGAAGLVAYGHRVNAVAEDMEYAPLNKFIQGLRHKLGLNVIPASKATRGVLRCLHRGEVLAMLFDAVEPGQGLKVDFFGSKAQFSSAPARIALRTGARVLPAVVCRKADDPVALTPLVDFDLSFEPTGDEEADVLALTQAIALSFERFVRLCPDQWFAFRPVWSTEEETKADTARDSGGWREWSLKLGVALGRWLPEPAAYTTARLAGDIAFRLRSATRRGVEDNMRHVMPMASASDVSRAAREAFRNVARYYVDLIRLQHQQPESFVRRRVKIIGLERITEPMKAGRGVVIATAHFGNPEVAVQVGAAIGLNILVLAEPLQPPSFARLMAQIRASFGPRYIDVGFSAIAECIRHLRGGGALAITCDRDIQAGGVPLEFFGEPALLPLGAVELAARTNSVLVPGFCRRVGRHFEITFQEPLALVHAGETKADAMVNAGALLRRAEAIIRSDPGQWMVLERIWKASKPSDALASADTAQTRPPLDLQLPRR